MERIVAKGGGGGERRKKKRMRNDLETVVSTRVEEKLHREEGG